MSDNSCIMEIRNTNELSVTFPLITATTVRAAQGFTLDVRES